MARDLRGHPDYTDYDGDGETDPANGGHSWPWPWWGWLVMLVVVAVFVGIAWVIIADERASRAAGSPWQPLGYPSTSVGGGQVYTRCAGPTRLFLTVAADGFPAGPAQAVDAAHGAGCGS